MSAPQRTTPKPGVDVDANTTLEDRRVRGRLPGSGPLLAPFSFDSVGWPSRQPF
jgi:hypothetical protein